MMHNLHKLPEYYRKMLTIRYFEEKIDFLFTRNLISGTSHLCIGQEAIAIGACDALNHEDLVTSTHRGHGHAIAKGLEIHQLLAEIMGKETGYCKGKGGTQHIACIAKGFLGTNGITGGGIPIATGAALSAKLRKTGQVVLCFFGDGASNQGTFHESLNMASIWKLPVVYICENNLYAMSTPVSASTSVKDIALRSQAYGMPGSIVDGNDVLAVNASTRESVDWARNGHGPWLLECKTYRHKGHSKSDMREYRTRQEEEQWKEKDPIQNAKQMILNNGLLTVEELEQINQEVRDSIEQAVQFAMNSLEPDSNELYEDVY